MPDVFQEVAACVQVTIVGVYVPSGSQMVNVLNFQTPVAAPTAAEVQACVSLVDEFVTEDYMPLISQDIRVIRLEGKSRAASVAPFFNLPMNELGGAWVVDEVAHAPLILLHGPLSSRHQAGKCYTFPPQSGLAAAGFYATGHMDNLVLAFTRLKVLSYNAGYPLAVASPELRTCVPVSNITYSPRLTMMTTRRPNFGEG